MFVILENMADIFKQNSHSKQDMLKTSLCQFREEDLLQR